MKNFLNYYSFYFTQSLSAYIPTLEFDMHTINSVFVVGNKSVLKFSPINISFKCYIRILHTVLFLHSELIWYRIFTINSVALANERNLIKTGGIPIRSELSIYIYIYIYIYIWRVVMLFAFTACTCPSGISF